MCKHCLRSWPPDESWDRRLIFEGPGGERLPVSRMEESGGKLLVTLVRAYPSAVRGHLSPGSFVTVDMAEPGGWRAVERAV